MRTARFFDLAAFGTALARSALAMTLALACAAAAPEAAAAAPLITGLGGSSGFGTLAMGRNDDGSSGVIQLGSGFPFGIKLFTGTYASAYINNNGNITFQAPLGTYTPTPFPITNLPMLAPFWGDVDTRGGVTDPARNNVYYSTAIPGKFIITWYYVGYYSGGTNKLNAFQMVLTDRHDVAQGDFDLEYRYEQLEWTTGSASGGSNGLGGTPAQMGYDAGDGKNFYRHPDSGSAAILALTDTSNVGEPGVWRFEVRGGTPNPVHTPNLVDVRLIETLNAADIAIDPASFQSAPQSVTTQNGQTVIEWDFAAFPANLTKDLSFDVLFKNPVPGERRQLVSKLELLYKDINGNPVRTELGAQDIQVLPSIYQVTPSSDKAVYGANETVQISSLVNNLSAFPAAAAVRVSVLDNTGALVALVGTSPSATLAGGAAQAFGGMQFATGTHYAGAYRLVAELLDANGKLSATGSSAFAIAAASGLSVQAAISTDKQLYNPFDTVRLSERVVNQLVNASVDDLRLVTSVRNPDGSERMSSSASLAQLPAAGTRDFAYPLSLGWAAAGRYPATLSVTKADGSLLAQASTAFTVASSADSGAGLTGIISAAPAIANNGQAVKLAFRATNNGNATLNALPLTVSVLDPDLQHVVASYPYAATLAVGGYYPGTADWQAATNPSGNYVAVLSAAVAGKTLTLAQTPLTVLTLDIGQSARQGNRVLALVSCLDDEETAPAAACLTERSRTIDSALTAAGVSHLIVGDESAFKAAFRSGLYNTYWISGKQDKLHDVLASEVREAVFGGDGALIDSEHDQRNSTLDSMAGVRWRGKFGALNLGVDVDGPLFTAQHLASSGRSDRLETDGALRQASFADTPGNADDAAIVSNQFGAGRVVQYAFDLPASLRAEAAWQPLLVTSLAHVLPPLADSISPGAVVPLTIKVANQGPQTGISVDSVLPAGAAYLGATPAPRYDAALGTLGWTASLASGQGWEAALTVRAPAAGPGVLRTVVATADPLSGALNPYGAPLVLPLNVVGAAQSASEALAVLSGYAGLDNKEARLRDQLVAQLGSAMAALRLNTASGYDSAIGQLIGVIDGLAQLHDVDTLTVRVRIDRIVREAGWRWSQLPPGK